MKSKKLLLGMLCSIAFVCVPFSTVASARISVSNDRILATDAPVALNAENIRNTTFDAQWTAVEGATSYRLDVSTIPFGQFADESYVIENLSVGIVTSYTVTGLQPGTPYYYRVRAVGSGGTSINSNTVGVLTTEVTIWNGTEWSDLPPSANVNAVIEGNYRTIQNGTFTAKNLTIGDNGTFLLNSGTNLTVVNSVINNNAATAFEIQNNANLLQLAEMTGNIGAVTVNRNASMRRLDYVYWASPVANQNLQSFSMETLSNRFYTLSETNNVFEYIDPSANAFTPGSGFIIRAPNTFTTSVQTFNGEFSGIPNNGTVSVPVTTNGMGYNLLGNPYPSTISTTAFLGGNPDLEALYFWTHQSQLEGDGANYATVNALGETAASTTTPVSETPNGTIQTGQGFIAKFTTAGVAQFTNTMRVANNNDQFFRTSTAETHRLWLNLSDANTAMSQVLIGYASNATNAVDQKFDAPLIDASGTKLYTLIDNATMYTIQGRAVPFNDNDTVKLGFSAASAGNYNIGLDHVDGIFSEDQDIFLKDSQTGTIINLKNENYSFATEAGNFPERFKIVYSATALGIDIPDGKINDVVIYTNGNQINIKATEEITDILVYDVTGKTVYQSTSNSTEAAINSISKTNALVLVRITTVDGNVILKKLIF